ncbi:MAG TPA: 4-(cytidine 5'-diphospho)-2-C-methyl-D-erythritol kinase [Candidatus Binatia bacterium]|nr:4-(cytidine 5'-diphospho)-2-C-methyl-D-erythritol kinase [Candidatus Binatia bacterium]
MNAARTARVLAPAKINLALRIVDRRADGYHLLDSLMTPIDLYDELFIRVDPRGRRSITVACDEAAVPSGPGNLAYRAAELFLARCSMSAAVSIDLHKRIPAGSGLGGGSSDAAAVLLALNEMLSGGRTRGRLAAWGAELGADVPFSVHGRPARVQGIGEQVSVLNGWPGIAMVVARPARGLSTAAIYRRFDERVREPEASLTKRDLATSIADFAAGRSPLRELLVNDLEAVAVEVCPDVGSVKTLLQELGADGTLMTGSGSAVFGVWPSLDAARTAAAAICDRGYWAVAAQTIDASPAIA